jgi:hypothetical protein
LPDISALNGTAVDNVREFDGLTVTLDTRASAAYSVRLLDSLLGVTYTGAAMRVRRETIGSAGDDDEADIAFDTSLTDPTISLDSAISNASFGVTATTLGQFLNVGTVNGTTYTNPDSLTVTASCLVDTWYDQAGSNDATQTTHGSQPQIHDGTVNTDLIQENGKPALQPLGNGDQFEKGITGVTAQYAFGVVKTTNSLNSILLTGASNASVYVLEGVNGATGSPSQSGRVNNYYKNGSSYSPANGDAVNDDTLNQTLYAIDMVGNAIDNTSIGYAWATSRCMFITQEIVIWNSDQSTNRSAIETDINGFFGIY